MPSAQEARAAAARTAVGTESAGASATPELTRDLLTLDPAKSGPLASYPYDDRVAFHDAFGDVRPLGAPAPGGKAKKPKASGVRGPRAVAERAHRDAAEEAARARLERLVVEGVSFQIRRDEHGVEAKRKGAAERTLLLILRGELTPEARVDLHGLGRDEATRVVGRFIKDARSKSRLTVLIIHGKGAHSEGGIGVLEEACVEALTKGGAAPYVEAFATAPARFGGRGAIVARLRDR
jgi:DNA-nicking Smr family endonuclease